jgi:hypothetical protein
MQWQGAHTEIGSGRVNLNESVLQFSLPAAHAECYSDAQIDDTTGRSRSDFLWKPPLQLSLRARFSHSVSELLGTAGFGFWNLPFGTGLGKLPALPRALWFFFGSPPNDLSLAAGVPGHGWKAASLDAGRPAALVWAPLTPFVLLAMRNKQIYHSLWPRIQRALAVHEMIISEDLCQWHHYQLDWQPDRACFWVDGQLCLDVSVVPRGPLGFVAWMDNQFAVATPRGRFRWGLLDIPQAQWFEIAQLRISPGIVDHRLA